MAEIASEQAEKKRSAEEAEISRQKAINDAANMLSPEQVAMQVRIALIQHLPEIIAQSVKPMEQISDIKILHVNGLGQNSGTDGNNTGTAAEPANSGSLADQVVSSALRYRAQAPILDSLLSVIGLKGADINGMAEAMNNPTALN